MITANDLRKDFIRDWVRSDKNKEMLNYYCERFIANNEYQQETEINNIVIGGQIEFIYTSRRGNNYSLSKKKGRLFAIGECNILVWANSGLHVVPRKDV